MRIRKAIRQFFSWVTLVSLLPVAVAILCSGYITYRYNVALNDTRALVRHSLEVTKAIDDLMLDLQDLETGQRGYLITGEDDYLEPFEIGRQRFDNDLSALRTLVSDNPVQLASIAAIAGLAGAKLDELQETIRVRRDEGFDAARAIVANDAGKATMDRIRQDVDTMRNHESDLLATNTNRVRSTENQVILIVGIAITLSLFGRLVALFLVNWLRLKPDQTDATS